MTSAAAAAGALILLTVGCAPASEHVSTPTVGAVSPTPTTTADPWAGHFQRRADEEKGDHLAQLWGSFGDVGAVAPTSLTTTISPGSHTVAVTCAGPPSVTVTLADVEGEGEPVAEEVVTCPGASTRSIELDTEAVTIAVDSDGETGAYLVQFD